MVVVHRKVIKKKERQSGVKDQQDVLAYMKERNAGDLMSNKVTMIKDLNISLSVLTNCWQELDKTLMTLEDDVDIENDPRKKARLAVCRMKMGDNEMETAAVQEEIRLIRTRDDDVHHVHNEVVLDMIINTENDESCDASFTNTNDSFSFEDLVCDQELSEIGEVVTRKRTSSSCSTNDLTLCCCGCGGKASGSSHRCSNTERKAMAYCLIGDEGYGISSFCRG